MRLSNTPRTIAQVELPRRMVNTSAMPQGRKKSFARIAEEKVQQALLQADPSRYYSFRMALNEVAATLTEYPNCFQEERNAFAALKRNASLGSFENRFFALFLHSLFVGKEFHQLTDARRKLEAELESEINPVRRRELKRKLDQHIPPIERTPISAVEWERMALLAKRGDTKWRRRSERTPKLEIGPWHEPMTSEEYGLRLGLSRSGVKNLLASIRPRLKAPRAGRVKARFTAVTNWRVLRQFLLTTKRSSEWKRDFYLGLLDYYRRNDCYTAHNKGRIRKAFAGIKTSPIPLDERTATLDYFLPPAPATVTDPFVKLLEAKSES